jgi:uncharacterized protein (DUF2252 family)
MDARARAEAKATKKAPYNKKGKAGGLPASEVMLGLGAEERRAEGKALREMTPRAAHAGWQAPSGRRDPIELLNESDLGRIPTLIPIRYGRMMQSPFAFYRGAAAIMAVDLVSTPKSGLHVQACGDAHLMNFGGFATPERNIFFDINDFDETLPAPWEWDVKRLSASIVIAARHLRMPDSDGAKAAGRHGVFLSRTDDRLRIYAGARRLLEPYAGKSAHKNHGERVVAGQRLMQSASDIFLGWTRGLNGRDYYLRQLRDTKISAVIEDWDVTLLREYGKLCAWALARAHARSGDAAKIAGYLGSNATFDDAVCEFAVEYADQNQEDYRAFVKAVREGRVTVVSET